MPQTVKRSTVTRRSRVLSAAALLFVAVALPSCTTPIPQKEPTAMPAPRVHDLSAPEYTPPETPAWAKVTVPDSMKPYLGKNGLASEWREVPGPLAKNVMGLDRYQANNFVCWRPETARFLYTEYTPTTISYKKGTLPAFEAFSAPLVAGCKTDTEKGVALLLKGLPSVKHPTVPPCSAPVGPGRNATDEELLKSRKAWCNEQARVFIRLCHVNGIPARIVHLFYSDRKTGHTIAEFYADGAWRMADASYICVFPGPDGQPMSAAQCHDEGEGQKYCGLAYYRRQQEMIKLSDAELNLPNKEDPAAWRARFGAESADYLAKKMWTFAVMNYPLPG